MDCISLMSAPAAKAFSEPVMTIAPMPWIGSKARVPRHFGEDLRVQRVQRLRPIERDQADLAARFGDDGFVGHGDPLVACGKALA